MKKKQFLKPQGAIKQDKRIIQDEEIKKNITIIEELKRLIPPLMEEELETLEANILKEGCRDPLLVWDRGEGAYVLIDGHNRFGICSQHGLDFKIKLMQFDSIEEVRDFMIDNQLGRRNLTPTQASYLRGLRYKNEKQKGFKQSETGGQTAEKLAAEYNVSPRSIERDAVYADGLDMLSPELKNEVLSGQAKIPKGDIQKLAKKKAEIVEPIQDEEDLKALIAEKNLERSKKQSALLEDDPYTMESKRLMTQLKTAIQNRHSEQIINTLSEFEDLVKLI